MNVYLETKNIQNPKGKIRGTFYGFYSGCANVCANQPWFFDEPVCNDHQACVFFERFCDIYGNQIGLVSHE